MRRLAGSRRPLPRRTLMWKKKRQRVCLLCRLPKTKTRSGSGSGSGRLRSGGGPRRCGGCPSGCRISCWQCRCGSRSLWRGGLLNGSSLSGRLVDASRPRSVSEGGRGRSCLPDSALPCGTFVWKQAIIVSSRFRLLYGRHRRWPCPCSGLLPCGAFVRK